MPLQLRLAEDELAVEGDLEATLVTAAQLHGAHDRRPPGEQLLGQAHGPVQVVSRNAELDRCFVLRIDHDAMLPGDATPYSEPCAHRLAAQQKNDRRRQGEVD